MKRKKIFSAYLIYQTALFTLDFILFAFALFVAVSMRLQHIDFLTYLDKYTGASIMSMVIYPAALYVYNFYDLKSYGRSTETGVRLLLAILSSLLIVGALSFLFPFWKSFRLIFALQGAWAFLFLLFIRKPVLTAMHRFRLVKPEKVLLVGRGKSADEILAVLKENSGDYEVVGILDNKTIEGSALPVLGRYSDLRRVVEKNQVTLIIPCISYAESARLIKVLFYLKMHGCDVIDMPVIYGMLTGKIPVQHVEDRWFVYGPYFTTHKKQLISNLSRIADVFLSVFILAVTLPFWFVIAILIKLTMPGPVFYFQTRSGLNKQPFRIIKFRTMIHNAEEKTGPAWSTGVNDPRVTRLGRFLRKARLDELPQLINVLLGEMSFIGPRPERPYFVQSLSKEIPYYDLRFSVRPGLTGWAQVNAPYANDVASSIEKLQYDLYYIQENSLLINLQIILKTMQTVLSKPGS